MYHCCEIAQTSIHTYIHTYIQTSIHTYIGSLDCREFTAASTNPTGDAVVLGNYNALFIFTRNKDTMSWEDKGVTKVSTSMYVCMEGGL